MQKSRGFGSDNNAGVHPAIFDALAEANEGHQPAYGFDPYTERAKAAFRYHFGNDITTFFVVGGTAANVLSLQTMTQPFNGILCSSVAHLNVDECGAPERFTGCKLIPIPTTDGKIYVDQLDEFIRGIGDEHHVQVAAISLTQSTEYGTIYRPAELKAITDFAHQRHLFVHMDGARIANAAVSIGTTDLAAITRGVGIDVLSFGGTKNGMMYGEAIVFFNNKLAENFRYIRKQGMQLTSKMRFIAAQFSALLSDNLWYANAWKANGWASCLAKELRAIPEVQITQSVESNSVFAILPKKIITALQEEFFFYVWNHQQGEVRLMTSFDTTESDIQTFIMVLKGLLSEA